MSAGSSRLLPPQARHPNQAMSQPAATELPNAKRMKPSYAVFDEHELVENIMEKKRQKFRCCGKTCLARINEELNKTHAQLLIFLFYLKPPEIRNRVFRVYVLTCFPANASNRGM